ncbi:hypothetical protein H7J73_09580 [Mycolicibacterium komossense]|uniref:DUF222 domain-containing protein n=1 Tax=Mycolicibacterium komossense TaxID=1779 RepID=A0ABT3C9Z1_9MYCO|nr:hypothetical protein [Mycolicibacterium komossense]
MELAIAVATRLPPGSTRRIPWSARLAAHMFARRYDRQVENRVPAMPGSALAVHTARLTGMREREELARALRAVLDSGREPRGGALPSRGALQCARLAAAEDIAGQVTLRLHAPQPVRARGIARLRLLLGDSAGPLYYSERGSVAAELRGVLAAL